MAQNHTTFVGTSLGTLAIMMCLTGQAHAQASGEASPAAEIGEVIVTAQRRAERARDVPISLTVHDSAALERAGVADMRDLRLVTPGLNIDRQAVHTMPSVRGVSGKDASPGNESPVAVYVDGVYQPTPSALMLDFPDVERIEVAKGPQGTLFGRNATGGAISVFTKKPDLHKFTGNVRLSYGRYDNELAQGFVSIPIVDGKAAISFTAQHEHRDGYFHNLFNNRSFGDFDTWMVRGKLLVQPTPWLTLTIAGMYEHKTDDAAMGTTVLRGNTTGRLRTPFPIIPNRPYDVAINPTSTFDVSNAVQSITANIDLGFASLTSITAHSRQRPFIFQDMDFTSYDAANVNRYDSRILVNTDSQELTLSSQGTGRLRWVTGLFFYKNRGEFAPLGIVTNNVTGLRIYGRQDTDAHAAFGEVTYSVTDSLTAIVGARYSAEKHKLGGHFNAAPDNPVIARKKFHSITPRFSLRYAITPQQNVYFTYSQGFKSGGFNAGTLSPIPFDEERLKAYEVGFKGALTPSLTLNVAAFYDQYDNQQEKAVVFIPSLGINQNIIANAAASTIYGLEADATWYATPDLRFTAAVALLHARYKSFKGANVVLPNTNCAALVPSGNPPGLCGNLNANVDLSGYPLTRAPDYTVSLGADYTRDVPGGELTLSGSIFYTDKFNPYQSGEIVQKAYPNVNARASYQPTGSKLRFSVWGKNLTNETVLVSTTVNPPSDAGTYSLPRTYGVQLDYSF